MALGAWARRVFAATSAPQAEAGSPGRHPEEMAGPETLEFLRALAVLAVAAAQRLLLDRPAGWAAPEAGAAGAEAEARRP